MASRRSSAGDTDNCPALCQRCQRRHGYGWCYGSHHSEYRECTLIGAFDSGGPGSFFEGTIDEVRIYNRALGPTEVAELYAAGAVLHNPPNNLGLVGYWSFNEGTSTVATDFSGNGNHGTLSGDTNWVNGKRGKALSFDGSGDYVSVANHASLNPTVITASAWIRASTASQAAFAPIVNKRNDSEPPYNNWILDTGLSGTTHEFCITDSGGTGPDFGQWCVASGALTTQWTHVVGTYDGTTQRLYVNGTEVNQRSVSISVASSNQPLRIGSAEGASTFFAGTIDEVRIYNRALGPTEVAKLYSSGAVRFTTSSVELQQGSTLANGLVGHWTFDGADVTMVIADRSGQNNHGYFNGGATSSAKVIGKLGQALNFDGTNDGVITASNLVYGSSVVSLAFWGYWTDTSQACDPFLVSGDMEAQAGAFHISPNLCDFGDDLTVGLSGTSETARVESAGRPSLNQWHHYVVVLNHSTNAGDIDIYIDGSLQSSAVERNNKNTSGNLTSTQLAMMHFPGSGTFATGKMDDVRVYNRALTAAEVKQLYQLGTVTIRQ